MVLLRKKIPQRSCSKTYKNYTDYKQYLRADFNNRCGYCDLGDFFIGGVSSYHIDHFAPKKFFPELTCHYSNLVYSCPSCNMAKLDDWPVYPEQTPSHDGVNGYVDPCLDEYDIHLTRLPNGDIEPQTELGKYIYKRLKLYLLRHALFWNLDHLMEVADELEVLLDTLSTTNERISELKDRHYECLKAYRKYHRLILEELG